MGTPHIVFIFMAMLLLAILVQPLAHKIKLPFSAALVLTGFLMSEAVVAVGMDTGLRWDNFQEIIFYLLIPALVFESASKIRLTDLRRELAPILMLAIPLMIISAAIVAIVVYFAIDHPTGFPWIAALITGALLSATDPASVLSMLKQNHAPERLGLLLEGESLFNDATAIVLFSLLLSLALANNDMAQTDLGMVVGRFLVIFLGGIATGIVFGIVAWLFASWQNNQTITTVITILSAYMSYLIAEDYFHLSGVMSVLACGIVFGECIRRKEGADHFVFEFWNVTGYIAVALLFLLAGFTINLDMFTSHWLAILFGIIGITIARAFCIFGLLPVANLLPGSSPISKGHKTIMTLGGVRGAVTLALALSIPIDLGYWYSIQSIAYGVVIFTLFIQSPLMPRIIRKYT